MVESGYDGGRLQDMVVDFAEGDTTSVMCCRQQIVGFTLLNHYRGGRGCFGYGLCVCVGGRG